MTDVTPAAPPIKPPPGNDSCAVCYFSEEDAAGIMRCCYNPPAWQRSSLGGSVPGSPIINWPIVDPTDWCGHGYNTSSSQWMNPANTPLA